MTAGYREMWPAAAWARLGVSALCPYPSDLKVHLAR